MPSLSQFADAEHGGDECGSDSGNSSVHVAGAGEGHGRWIAAPTSSRSAACSTKC